MKLETRETSLSAGGAARGNLPFWDGVWILETQAPHPLLIHLTVCRGSTSVVLMGLWHQSL